MSTTNIIIEDNDLLQKNNHNWNLLYKSAFTKSFFNRSDKISKPVSPNKKRKAGNYAILQVSVPKLDPNHSVCVTGDDIKLGSWDSEKYVPMKYIGKSLWELEIKITDKSQHVSYKFGIYDNKSKKLLAYEFGENRYLEFHDTDKTNVIEVKSNFKYENVQFQGAGVAIPVFSLRSEKSFGVGEFNDIKLLVDWCRKTGLKMIQILPVNDTTHTHTWVDTYPYSAISSFALHPMYLNVNQLGKLPKNITLSSIQKEADTLNSSDSIEYEKMMKAKTDLIEKIFEANKSSLENDKDFNSFIKENKEWLTPYAAYCYLRDELGTHDYREWGKFSKYSKNEIAKLTASSSKNYDKILLQYFIQFNLHKQLLEAADYARSNGIVLKGDIPIGVNKYGADTWVNPELFNMDCQTGAPPDDYAEDGQNWGFPTYNWAKMADDDFAWWKKRFTKLSEYFDAYRIDHILGFFRIWEIPNSAVSGLLGYFSPAIAVNSEELYSLDIGFDEKRFCEPYIRGHILDKYDKDIVAIAKKKYLEEYQDNCFRFKEKFNTQEKIKNELTVDKLTGEKKEQVSKLQKFLFKLIAEVLLIKDKNTPGLYHPRIAVQKTDSFADLDDESGKKFYDLYISYFYKRQENLWEQEVYQKLPSLISATNMLACGEDLGMVPDCVAEVMDNLGLLSLKIQRMPKEEYLDFGIPSLYPYLSVCTTSCHDMSTIRGWWEEDGKIRQKFYNNMLGGEGEAPVYCEPWICEQIINQHLYSTSMWAVFPIQDLVAIDIKLRRENPADEKINEPSIVPHYWKYRFHIPMEKLLKATVFNNHLLQLVNSSGRNSISY